MKEEFEHCALELTDKNKIIFIAMSKYVFFFRRHAVKYVLEEGFTPISQYGIFDYFLADAVERDLVRRANNNLIKLCDEMWVFGPISDGVLAEIKLVKEWEIPVKYFEIVKSKDVKEISKKEVVFEEDLEKFSDLL